MERERGMSAMIQKLVMIWCRIELRWLWWVGLSWVLLVVCYVKDDGRLEQDEGSDVFYILN